jgi:hypothetical protein
LSFVYLSFRDGNDCLWGNSFDPRKRTAGSAYAVKHYHDWGMQPSRILPDLLTISVRGDSIYLDTGEVSSTIWMGRLKRNPLADLIRTLFR